MIDNNYFIKEGYKCNLDEQGNPTELYTEVPSSRVFQVPVYQFVKNIVRQEKLKSVLELGSGSGYKLVKYIYPETDDITGIDQDFAVKYCKEHYDVGNWVVDDFDNSVGSIDRKFDVILSADVIEHIIKPEKLLNKIKQYADENTRIIISTPERDLVRGHETLGPPENKLHVREWNQKEFAQFIEMEGFEILEHNIVDAASMTPLQKIKSLIFGNKIRTCQMVYCKLK